MILAPKPKVIFRADGGSEIGLGHITRSLALADMLKKDFRTIFLTSAPSPEIQSKIKDICEDIIILPETKNLNEEANYLAAEFIERGDIVVLDGYNFTTEYQKIIKLKQTRVVCIDDIHAYHFIADIVINHSPGTEKERYSAESYTKFLLGADYALLRKPFIDAAEAGCKNKKGNTVFISFGGFDKFNITEKVIEICLQVENLNELHVVVGLSHADIIMRKFNNIDKVKIHANLTAQQMCDLMCRCTLAICPASTVVMEAAATGLKIISGFYVSNQESPYQNLARLKYVYPLGDFNMIKTNDLVNALNHVNDLNLAKPDKLIDGKQPERFQKVFKELSIS